jgi:CRP/FNR family transcriptional regulator, dissimilatory nitrate respiration regulator
MEETLSLLEKTAFLKGVDLFSGVPSEMLAQLAARAREVHFDAGQVIYREGEANHGLFMVVEGLVEVRKGRALDSVRGPGVGFGELALAEGEPHQTTAVATLDTHALQVATDAFFDTMLDFPEVALAMIRSLSTHIGEMAQRLHDLEGKIAVLNAALRQTGTEAPVYQSGAFRRPTGS